jgi:hypothetical protein
MVGTAVGNNVGASDGGVDGCSVGANDGWKVGTMKSDNYNNIKMIIKSSISISIIIDTTIGILVLE